MSGAVEAELADLLAAAGRRPLIRYRLESIDGLAKAAATDRGESIRNDEVRYELDEVGALQFTRRFSRTLCLKGLPPDWLVERSDSLPDAFAPLRSWLDQPEGVRSPHTDLLTLTPTDRIPVQTVWMATERTSAEAWFDLWSTLAEATVNCRGLFETLSDLPVWSRSWAADGHDVYLEDLEDRASYWLAWQAAEAAQQVIHPIFPSFGIYADGPHAGDIAMYSSGSVAPHIEDTGLSETGFLERLSSGERAWADAALANAAAEVEVQGWASLWRDKAIARLSASDRLDAALDALGPRENDLDPADADDLTAIVDRLDRRLIAIDDYLADPEPALNDLQLGPEHRDVVEEVKRNLGARAAFSPGVREVREMPVRLTAYDEPERHLHPAAQRRTAAALDHVRGDHVVIATHSHLFLGRPGWRHLHLSRTAEGTVLGEFDVSDLDQASTITMEMGLDRGELLSFVRYVLIVEGIVDRIVLETLYGNLLDAAGILLLPLHGIDEVNSLAELTIVGELLDVGVGVLADHARAKHLEADRLPKDATKEERALLDLRRQLARRGRTVDPFGLKRVDIIAYLDERIVRERFAGFPGWEALERQARRHGRAFKDEFEAVTGAPIRYGLVKRLVESMATAGLPAPGDLPHVVARIVERAGEASTLDPSTEE